MSDRPGDTLSSNAGRNAAPRRMAFTNADEYNLHGTKPMPVPRRLHEGVFRRVPNPFYPNVGDAYNDYLQYLEDLDAGSSVISDFTNITGSQQNVVLADFTLMGKKGVAKDTPYAMERLYADMDNLSWTGNIGGSWPDTTSQAANVVAQTVFLNFDDKAGDLKKGYDALTPQEQVKVMEGLLAAQASGKPWGFTQIQSAIADQQQKHTDTTIVEIVVGTVVVAAGAYVAWSLISSS